MNSNDQLGDGPDSTPGVTGGPDTMAGDEQSHGSGAAGSSERARRESGARREVNEMVVLHGGEHPIEGWTLNMSRGGMRAIFDETVPVGDDFDLAFGQEGARRPVRVVWARAEKGGAIVGMAFLDVVGGSIPPPPSRAPAAPPAGPDGQG